MSTTPSKTTIPPMEVSPGREHFRHLHKDLTGMVLPFLLSFFSRKLEKPVHLDCSSMMHHSVFRQLEDLLEKGYTIPDNALAAYARHYKSFGDEVAQIATLAYERHCEHIVKWVESVMPLMTREEGLSDADLYREHRKRFADIKSTIISSQEVREQHLKQKSDKIKENEVSLKKLENFIADNKDDLLNAGIVAMAKKQVETYTDAIKHLQLEIDLIESLSRREVKIVEN